MDDDDALGCLFAFLPFSLGRTINTIVSAAVLSIVPAALLSGSGGYGEGFHERRFVAIVAVSVVVAVGVVTAIAVVRERRQSG